MQPPCSRDSTCILPDQDALDACVEIAGEVPGVSQVINDLKTMRRR